MASASQTSVQLSLEPAREVDACGVPSSQAGEGAAARRTFDAVYQTHAPFVWRNACRLGVPRSAAEDVMQEVFLVVLRRLPQFEERTSIRAWLSAILIRVVRGYSRSVRRKHPERDVDSALTPDSLVDPKSRTPLEHAELDEAVRELYAVVSRMDEERREVLVLAELEGLTVPEIAEALQVNLNTVYGRLRTARKEFEQILFRLRARQARSSR